MTDLSTSPHAGDTTRTYPAELPAAIIVARRVLATHGTIDHGDTAAANSAHGALCESLRILLRALGVEPDPKGRVAELHRLCAADYANAAARREQNRRDDAHLVAPDAAAVQRSVEAQFPAMTAFLANERGGQ